jgi:hypothetical protein
MAAGLVPFSLAVSRLGNLNLRLKDIIKRSPLTAKLLKEEFTSTTAADRINSLNCISIILLHFLKTIKIKGE